MAKKQISPSPGRPFQVWIPITTALIVGVVLTLGIALGSVLAINYFSERENTIRLIQDRADLALTLLETRIRGELEPIRELGMGVANLISESLSDPNDMSDVRLTLFSTMNAVPLATAMVFVDMDFHTIQVSRNGSDVTEVIETGVMVAGLKGMMAEK
jgi:hypothetical protein